MEETAPVAPAPDASGVTAPAAPVSSAPATPLPPADWKEVAADPWFQGLDAPGKAAAVSQWRDAWSGWGAAQKEAPEGWRDRLDAEANAFAQHAALKAEDFKGSETPPAAEAPAVSGEESPGALRGSLNAFARYMWNRPNEWAESGILPRFLGGSGGALGKADDARALRSAAEEQQALAERGFMTAENRAGAKAKREQAAALEAEAAAEVSASARSRALAEEFFPKTDAERAVDRAKGFSETASTLAENPSAVLPWMAESAVPIAKGAATALLPGGWLAKAATASGIFGSDAYAATRAGEIVRAAQERGIDPENREAMLALLRDPKFLDEAERRANIAGAGAAAVGAVLPVSNLAGQAAERAVASGAKELVKVGAREVVREVAPGAARTAAAKAAGVVADAGVQGALGVAADTVEQLAAEGEVDTGRLLRRGLTDALTGAAFRVAHGMGDGVEAAQAEKAALDARDRAIVDDFASRHGYDLTTKEWSGPESEAGKAAPPSEVTPATPEVSARPEPVKVGEAEGGRTMPLAAKREPAADELSLEGPRPYEAPWQPTEEEVRLYGDQRGLGDRLAERVKDTKDDLVGFVRSNFTSRGAAPESVFNLKEFSQGQAVKTALRIGWADRDMRQAMKADGIPFDAESYRRINAALAGVESSKESLPPATRSALNEMRAIVDGVTAELVEAGAVASGKMDVLEGNRGSYLHRSYRHFDDPSWAKKVPAHLKNRVAAVFQEEMPGLTKAEADGYVANLLHREDGPVAALARLGKREQSVLMKRAEIHPAVRAMWGEYEDPFVNFAKSVEKMSRLLEAHKLQVAIEKVGKGVFLFDTPGEKARHHVQVGGAERGAFAELAKARKAAMELSPNDEGGLSPVSSEDLQRSLGPLAKYYTTPEIAGLLRNLDNSADDTNKFMRAALKASGVSQYAKTVLSPVTHVRNMTGNVAIMLANGNWSPGGLSEASKAMVGMTKMSPKAWRERTARYAELGLIGESVSANILRETIRRAHVGERSAPGKFLEAVNKAYGMEDDFFKVYAFEGELAKLKQAFPERPLAELEAEAANVVKDTVPTFSRAPKAVAMLRRQPFIGNFVGFPAELTRTSVGTMARGIKELSTPGYREIGAKRLAALIAVAAVAPMALQSSARRALGWTEDKERAAREFLPEYMRSSPVVWLGDKDGKYRVLSLDGTNPYSYFHKPVIQSLRLMLEGDPSAGTLEKAIVGFSEVMAPYTDERVLYGRINDVLRNSERLTGREIYNPTDPLSYKLKKGVGHVLAAFAPGAVDTGRRIAKAAAGVVEESGRTYDLKDEVNAALTGQRVTVVDVNKAVSGRFREFNTREAEALGPWRDAQKAVANGATETTAETLVKAWQDSQERRWREYSAMNRTAKAALTLNGGNRREVVQAMRDAKMGSAESASVLGGVFMPTLPDASNKDFAVRIATLPGGKEAMLEILRRAIILKDKPLDKPMPETGR